MNIPIFLKFVEENTPTIEKYRSFCSEILYCRICNARKSCEESSDTFSKRVRIEDTDMEFLKEYYPEYMI